MFEILEHLLYVNFKDISRTLERSYSFQVLFGLRFYVIVNSYGHVDGQFLSNKSFVNNTDLHYIHNSTSEMLD